MASNGELTHTILEGVNLNDHKEVRKFMTGFEYHLTRSILNTSFEAVCRLSTYEHALISNIMACIRNNGTKYPLLLEASLRFVSSRHRDAQGVLAAAHEFNDLAEEQVLTAPYLFPEEYKAAEVHMMAIRGGIDIMRVRQRLVELAPGAFGEQIYHTGRSAEIEKMAARQTGDVRDIPRDVQFAPHPIPDGPRGLNSGPCHQCTRDNKPCDFKEPKCTTCRSSWRQCIYATPSRIIQEPATQSPNSSPLSYQSSSPIVSSLESSPGSLSTQEATATKMAKSKPVESKPAESKPAESKPAESKPAESKHAASNPATVAPKTVAPKIAVPKPATAMLAASKPAKSLPPPPGRVTRSTAIFKFPAAGELANGSTPPIQTANNEADNPQGPVSPQTETKKRKQEDSNEPAGPQTSKKAKLDVTTEQPATNGSISGVKRSAANAEIDNGPNQEFTKKQKTDSGTQHTSSSGIEIDGKLKKRRGRGGKEVQNHEGEKLCNTCQGWKPIADFATKKHSKIPGATVGYCVGCQGKKQAKNKAKAEAKARARSATTQKSEAVGSAEIGEHIEYDCRDDAPEEDDKTLDGIAVNTEG